MLLSHPNSQVLRVKTMGLGARQPWGRIPALPCSSSVNLGRFLSLYFNFLLCQMSVTMVPTSMGLENWVYANHFRTMRAHCTYYVTVTYRYYYCCSYCASRTTVARATAPHGHHR